MRVVRDFFNSPRLSSTRPNEDESCRELMRNLIARKKNPATLKQCLKKLQFLESVRELTGV